MVGGLRHTLTSALSLLRTLGPGGLCLLLLMLWFIIMFVGMLGDADPRPRPLTPGVHYQSDHIAVRLPMFEMEIETEVGGQVCFFFFLFFFFFVAQQNKQLFFITDSRLSEAC